jgi:hypothetical protein
MGLPRPFDDGVGLLARVEPASIVTGWRAKAGFSSASYMIQVSLSCCERQSGSSPKTRTRSAHP